MKGKVAVVTGASRGIGFTIANDLVEAGWDVYGISRNRPDEKYYFKYIKFDLYLLAKLRSLVNKLPKKIDLLINNAGVSYKKPVSDLEMNDFNKIMNINFYAPVLLTKYVLPKMRKGGMIINVSSIISRIGYANFSVYAASKAGMDRFTTSLAAERSDLKIVAILPAAVDTPQLHGIHKKEFEYDKVLKPEEVSNVIIQAVKGRFESGELVVVTNDWMEGWWEDRDKYIIVNIDKNEN